MSILARSFAHWTPTYLLSRTAEYVYQKRNAEMPWLTPTANTILDSYLKPTDVGLEWGSGRSTVWFASRVRHITSVEHHAGWHARISEQLRTRGIGNADYLLIDARDEVEPAADVSNEPYVRVSERFADHGLDFALVDGMYRSACALAVLPKIRPGGLLVLDNANWFLPTQSSAPGSRRASHGPSTDSWREFVARVADWRCIWTTSGVTDTVFWIRPCHNRSPA